MSTQKGYLEQNMLALMERNPVLAEKMLTHEIDPSWSLVDTPNNCYAACRDSRDGSYLFSNSAIDPLQEADEWCSLFQSDYCSVIVLGFGLGYHVRHLLKGENRIKSVIVIEAGKDLFGVSLICSDLTDLIGNPNCQLLVDESPTSMAAHIKHCCRPPLCLRKYLPAVRLYPDYYETAEKVVEPVVYETNVNDAQDNRAVAGILQFMEQLG